MTVKDSAKVGADRCESPIEVMLCGAFAAAMPEFDARSPSAHQWEVGRWPGWHLALLAQPIIGQFRADFAIMSVFPEDTERSPFALIVEADGHDFHERTKEQARRDRSRDRFFAENDFHLLRFTGSEIAADAHACAHQAMSLAIRLQGSNLNKRFAEWLEQEAAL